MSVTAVTVAQEPQTPSKPPHQPEAPRHLALRLCVIALFLMAVNAWLIAHLEVDARKLAGVEAFVAALGSLLTLLNKKEIAQIKSMSRRFVFAILHTSMLTIVWIVFITTASFISSVVVYAGGTANVGTVGLATAEGQSLGSERLATADDHVRFLAATTPFGRPMHIDTKDYRRYSFDLFPWAPKRIRVPVDLELSPSILLRVPNAKRPVLTTSRLRLADAQGKIIAEQQTSQDITAILIGAQRPIPDRLVESWQRQLAHEAEPDAAGVIDAWLTPKSVEPGQPIRVGDSMRASMIGPAGTEIASQPFIVSSEPLQDIRLQWH